VSENVEHLAELEALALRLGVSKKVTFVPNFTNEQRTWLFARTICLVYTPSNEHYGLIFLFFFVSLFLSSF